MIIENNPNTHIIILSNLDKDKLIPTPKEVHANLVTAMFAGNVKINIQRKGYRTKLTSLEDMMFLVDRLYNYNHNNARVRGPVDILLYVTFGNCTLKLVK